MFAGARQKEKWEVSANMYGCLLGYDENILELDSADNWILLHILKNTEITLKGEFYST